MLQDSVKHRRSPPGLGPLDAVVVSPTASREHQKSEMTTANGQATRHACNLGLPIRQPRSKLSDDLATARYARHDLAAAHMRAGVSLRRAGICHTR